MTQAKGPASAGTLPSRGSNIPQKETKMNEKTDITDAAAAPALSRRRFMSIAAAGSAATLPAVALAGASDKTSRLPQPLVSIEAQLDECVARLGEILARMYPEATQIRSGFEHGRLDGSFRFMILGDCQFGTFGGPGLYEISVDGYPMTYWLEERCHCSLKTGRPIQGMEYYLATLWMDGRLCENNQRTMSSPAIMRKLDWVPA
jgi:hypothetical protein